MAERPDADDSGASPERAFAPERASTAERGPAVERGSMAEHLSTLDRDRGDGGRTSPTGWRLWAPVAFILVSLGALFLVPLLIADQILEYRDVLETRVEPARNLVDDLELSFAREAAAIRTYLLTNSPAAADLYRRVRRVSTRQLEMLHRVAYWPETGPARSFLDVAAQVEAWHRNHDALLTGRVTPAEYARISPPEDPRYERILRSTARLDDQIAAYGARTIARIEAASGLGTALAVGLAFMALVSALVLIGIQRRLQALTRNLNRRARDEEALRRAAAVLSAPGGVDDTLERIAASAVHTMRADGAFVERLGPDPQSLTVVAAAGTRVPEVGATGPYEGSVAEQALTRGEPFRVGEIAGFKTPGENRIFDRCRHCAALVVPLSEGGEAFGTLFLFRLPGRPGFDRDDLSGARILGNLASLAWRKATALEDSERARRELENAMEARARMVRGFSHDVKNPLGAADGYLELMELGLKGELTDPQRESVAHSRRSIRSALELIQEMVDLARAEAGQLPLKREVVDVSELAHAATEAYRAKVESAGLTLDADIESELPPVAADPDRVGQILSNLISNAVTYTPEGGRVTVHARRCHAPPTADRPPESGPKPGPEQGVCIDIADTGTGIPEDKREAIFEEFTRLAPEAGRGAGLGLAISRRLARLMGGDLTVESEVGRGSTFTLWLPLAAVERAARPAA